VLRIDENAKTLEAPEGGLVTEPAPERDELIALIAGSFEPFAEELGMPELRLAATEPEPGIDLLAYDEEALSAVVLQVTGDTVEWQLSRDLAAAAEVASWDAEKLASVHEVLADATPGASPRLVLIAGAFDPRALATSEWLRRRHAVDVICFRIGVLRIGSERLLTVSAEPADGAPEDPIAQLGAGVERRSGRARRRWLRDTDDAEQPAALGAVKTGRS
jgi:hypothetical protein